MVSPLEDLNGCGCSTGPESTWIVSIWRAALALQPTSWGGHGVMACATRRVLVVWILGVDATASARDATDIGRILQ